MGQIEAASFVRFACALAGISTVPGEIAEAEGSLAEFSAELMSGVVAQIQSCGNLGDPDLTLLDKAGQRLYCEETGAVPKW